MKVLFVHDHIFKVKGNDVYSDKIPNSVLKRYTSVFTEITVLARSVEDLNCNLPLSSGDNIHFIFMEKIGSLSSYFGKRQEIEKKIKLILKDFDAIIVRLPSEYGSLVAKIANSMKIPIAVEVVGCAWDAFWNYGSLKAKFYAPLGVIKMRNTISLSNHVLYVTEIFLQKRYPYKKNAITTSVSNVELIDVDKNVLEKRINKINEYKNEKIIFGTIGSFKTKYKGIDLAFEILSKLKQEYSFEYHILGDGDKDFYLKIAERYGIKDKVFFDGLLPSGKPVYDWLDGIDIYLQPSLQEGLPRATIEALSRACPIVGSYAGGIPELISNDLLSSPKDINNFLSKIMLLINNKGKLKYEAEKNFNTSVKYQKIILDKKRSEFWSNFKDYIIKQEKNYGIE